MGSTSPSPHITPELEQQIMNSIIYPTINALKEKGILYTGVLYAGLMLTKDGPKVIEFNCRLGDPETQSILSRLDSDLFELCAATVTEHLFTINLKWKDEKAVTVMVASGGYPEKYTKGYAITGLDETDVKLFHSGTTLKDNKIVTSGGRVIAATALGKTYKEAQEKAYQKIDTLSFKDRYYRTDIGLVSK